METLENLRLQYSVCPLQGVVFDALGRAEVVADPVALLAAVGPPTMAVKSSVRVDEVAVAFCARDVLVASAMPKLLFAVAVTELLRSLGVDGREMEESCAVA